MKALVDGIFQEITTPIYSVNLRDIEERVPHLKKTTLISHRAPNGNGWAVTHVLTGARIGKGPTRKEAVDNARRMLLMAGNANFLKAIQHNLDKYGTANN